MPEHRDNQEPHRSLSDNRTVLLVDDEPQVLTSLQRGLALNGFQVFTAPSGAEGLEVLAAHEVGVVVSDQMMPGMTGLEFLEAVREHNPDIARILLTGFGSLNNAMAAINSSHVFSYLVKPCKLEVIQETVGRGLESYNLLTENRLLREEVGRRNRDLEELNSSLDGMVQKRTRQLEDAVKEGVYMLAMAAEVRERGTGDHIRRIEIITRDTCLALGLPPDAAEDFGFFSIMHDVGKLCVPDHILNKGLPLTPEEFEVIKEHTVAGERILGRSPFYHLARQVARHHHENWDGTGYPDGLAGEEIPLVARVVAVADTFDALAHERPYKGAWPQEQIAEEIRRHAGTKYQPEIVDTFLRIMPEKFKTWLQVGELLPVG